MSGLEIKLISNLKIDEPDSKYLIVLLIGATPGLNGIFL